MSSGVIRADVVRQAGEDDPMMKSPFGQGSLGSPVYSTGQALPRLYVRIFFMLLRDY